MGPLSRLSLVSQRLASVRTGGEMGGLVSHTVLPEDSLCRSHSCRDEVAHEIGGDVQFGLDRNGVKWKCIPRRQLRGDVGDGKGWACTELDCRLAPNGILDHAFHYDTDCTHIVATVDGAEVPDASRNGADYQPVEKMGMPKPPGCSAAGM